MEKLQIQKLGSVAVEFVEIDDSLDNEYKPGLYKQTEAFLSGDVSNLCTLSDQKQHIDLYSRIAGYNEKELDMKYNITIQPAGVSYTSDENLLDDAISQSVPLSIAAKQVNVVCSSEVISGSVENENGELVTQGAF
ncbi:hypothetical protein [Vibrio taketomensis]|uniref:hypothetical protein n=1 Tax=Vibrio taketomensis TaxID=2572923 RepID=UPI001E311257|nr:hypothetical protein [Vibrio taketomensis]